MKVEHFTEQPALDFPGQEGVNIRWMVGKRDGAPNFALRVIEVAPGQNTPFHAHDYEHEVFILAGSGELRDADQQGHTFEAGSVIYIEPNAQHGFYNTGTDTLRFVCVVPHVEGLEPTEAQPESGAVC